MYEKYVWNVWPHLRPIICTTKFNYAGSERSHDGWYPTLPRRGVARRGQIPLSRKCRKCASCCLLTSYQAKAVLKILDSLENVTMVILDYLVSLAPAAICNCQCWHPHSVNLTTITYSTLICVCSSDDHYLPVIREGNGRQTYKGVLYYSKFGAECFALQCFHYSCKLVLACTFWKLGGYLLMLGACARGLR